MSLLSLRLFVGVIMLILIGACLGCIELGRQMGQRRVAQLGPEALEGFGAVEGAVFALLGLLLAFTFSAAASRFDARRELIVKEANAIGTAYLRLDLLPASSQRTLRPLFRSYVDTRMDLFRRIGTFHYPAAEIERVAELQRQIWDAAVAGSEAAKLPQSALLVLPAINAMIDVSTERSIALRAHIPGLVIVLLFILLLACSVLAGYGMAHVSSRSWTHMVAFAVVLALTIYVTLDYEFPRFGLIRIEWVDRALAEVRSGMR